MHGRDRHQRDGRAWGAPLQRRTVIPTAVRRVPGLRRRLLAAMLRPERRYRTIVATIAHNIWLASILALASIAGLLAIVLAVSRKLAGSENEY
jgi:hypothetical protein